MYKVIFAFENGRETAHPIEMQAVPRIGEVVVHEQLAYDVVGVCHYTRSCSILVKLLLSVGMK